MFQSSSNSANSRSDSRTEKGEGRYKVSFSSLFGQNEFLLFFSRLVESLYKTIYLFIKNWQNLKNWNMFPVILLKNPTSSSRLHINVISRSIEMSLNESRLQCCLCQLAEKRVLLRPCNHLCLCERCNDAFQKQIPLLCPLCYIPVKSFDVVHFS